MFKRDKIDTRLTQDLVRIKYSVVSSWKYLNTILFNMINEMESYNVHKSLKEHKTRSKTKSKIDSPLLGTPL